ncbi:hypothetical protein [Spodoptera cosmioides nucleopolyhedrovirus]|uniref:Uncharacterized protein n=1 Tax=Spodoptera cosmioides nucleopolyhedrovirus TaxID=2605774 RepID=A0A6B7KIC6_9ABAC|nr:hypothetical protein [Spodoptera cosmioides nucleopolyhedrovirus]
MELSVEEINIDVDEINIVKLIVFLMKIIHLSRKWDCLKLNLNCNFDKTKNSVAEMK